MKSVNYKINLYSFSELEEGAARKAIEEHRNFLLSVMSPSDFISGDTDYDTKEELEKSYNAEYEYCLYNDDPIIESIEANEYLFFPDGEMAHIIYRDCVPYLKLYGQTIKL